MVFAELNVLEITPFGDITFNLVFIAQSDTKTNQNIYELGIIEN
jgi:hypothetical protein